MTKSKNVEAEIDQYIVDHINQELAKAALLPEPDDLGIKLPEPGAPRGQWLRDGSAIHDIDESRPKPRKLPQPPYRCVCGIVFATAKELLDHRH